MLEKKNSKIVQSKNKTEEEKLHKREIKRTENLMAVKRKELEDNAARKMEARNLEALIEERQSIDLRKFYCVFFIILFCVGLYFFIKLRIESKRDYIF